MKRVIMDREIELNAQNYRINTNKSRGQGCFVEILHAIESNLTAMLSYHCKVFVVQFVIHCHDYERTNRGMSNLMRVFKKRLLRRYGFLRMSGGWVRETGHSGIQHYHVALFLDGNKVRWILGVKDLITEIMTVRGYPCPSFVKSHMIHRGQQQSIREAFYHLSYLAKIRSKSERAPATNDYSFSRLKSKEKSQPIATCSVC
jgi:hypothetical protein